MHRSSTRGTAASRPSRFGRMIASFLLIGAAASFSHPLPSEAADMPAGFLFQKNLKQGDSVNPDVAFLQYTLNLSADTQVAAAGAGSQSELTTYFGTKTRSAVIRFQEKYASEILAPLGLSKGTGYVAEKTRFKLNQILSQVMQGSSTPVQANFPAQPATSDSASAGTAGYAASAASQGTDSSIKSIIGSFSAYKAYSGQMLSLNGANFPATGNTVYLGSQNVGTYVSANAGTQITFLIPSSLETGTYEVGLVNAYGTTSTGFNYLNVINPATASSSDPAPATFEPVIKALYPATSTNINDLIYITGDNFSLSNTLETNLGNTTVRSTDKKNLAFLIGELPQYMTYFQNNQGKSVAVTMRLRNENGLSQQSVTHVIQFPNSTAPTVNMNSQTPPAGFLATTTDAVTDAAYRSQLEYQDANGGQAADATGTSSTTLDAAYYTSQTGAPTGAAGGQVENKSGLLGSDGSGSGGSSMQPKVDPALEELRKVSPLHKFLSDPLVNPGTLPDTSSLFGGKGGSGGGAGAGAAGGALGGMGGGAGGAGGAGGSGGSADHFGGQITQVTYCTCSGSILLGIRDIASSQTLQVFFRYGQSSLKMNYNIFEPNINVIGGLNGGGGACMVYAGTSCTSEGNAQYTIDFIRGIGTGAIPDSGGSGAAGGAGGI